jgi:putative DNA primase/helicase
MENDHVTQFADALRAAGIILKGAPVFDDRIHRVDVEGKTGGRDGSYRVKVEGDRAYGWYQNWTIHTEPQKWHANGEHRLTREQRRHLTEERAAKNAERNKSLLEQHQRAAAECTELWDGAQPVETHPYLTSKGVPSHGLRQGVEGQQVTIFRDDGSPHIIHLEGKLFIPMLDVTGKLWSLQYIRDDGLKRYHPGGRKEGLFFPIEGLQGTGFVAEGYATGASVHQLSGGYATAVAFDSGNLLPVCKALAPRHPFLAVAGDNDFAREQETGADGNPKPNTGKLAARAAADAVRCIAVMPEFAPEENDASDWNDLIKLRGLDDARAQFRRAMQMAKRASHDSKTPVDRTVEESTRLR